jgi:hypothetical protein
MSDAERLRDPGELAGVLEARPATSKLAKRAGSMTTLLAVEMELGRYRDGKNRSRKSDLMEGLRKSSAARTGPQTASARSPTTLKRNGGSAAGSSPARPRSIG